MATTSLSATSNLLVEAGCDVVDRFGAQVDDVTSDLDLSGSSISYGSEGLRATCRLRLARRLDWGRVRLRPWMRLTDRAAGRTGDRWHLGVFVPESPEETVGERPPSFDVTGYDQTVLLDTSVGRSWLVRAGEGVLTAAGLALHMAARDVSVITDPTERELLVRSDRLWPLGEENTWRYIVDQLAESVDYETVWADRDGTFRLRRHISPIFRPIAEVWSTTEAMSVLDDVLVWRSDQWARPNQWVFVRDDPTPELDIPVPGDGLLTVRNESDGPSSIDARGGRVVTRIVRLDTADDTRFVTQADRIVEDDKAVAETLRVAVTPQPQLWHEDVVSVTVPEIGWERVRCVVAEWRLPLGGENMTLTLRRLALPPGVSS